MVPRIVTTSGMMLYAPVPPVIPQIESTPQSRGCRFRDTIDCSAVMTWAAMRIGSTTTCGCEPCPPRPMILTSSSATWAMTGPALTVRSPSATNGRLCSP
eukprot:Amastigsp_a339553_7.p5 type:complete len:100 gc:universal Amastigsp_a339553_7:883-584(-)